MKKDLVARFTANMLRGEPYAEDMVRMFSCLREYDKERFCKLDSRCLGHYSYGVCIEIILFKEDPHIRIRIISSFEYNTIAVQLLLCPAFRACWGLSRSEP